MRPAEYGTADMNVKKPLKIVKTIGNFKKWCDSKLRRSQTSVLMGQLDIYTL
jgi:hypothetical protein